MIIIIKLRIKNFENLKQINWFLINIGLNFIKLMNKCYLDFLIKNKNISTYL